ncbi:MAG TPA: bestrophin family ion channel [Oculatellaceae cyanobacterium]
MNREKYHWFRVAFQLRGSVIPAILPRVILCGGFGVFISILYYLKFPVYVQVFSNIVPSIVLSLLLVFRTNSASERFWDGSKCWGVLVVTTRNLAREIWISIEEKDPQDIINKKATLRLLAAFAVAMKLHLRKEPVNAEIEALVSPSQYAKLKQVNHPPLEIAFWIGDYLQNQYECDRVDVYQLTGMKKLLSGMVDQLGGCERIARTPMPFAYAIHLKQLLLLYCLALPFQLVKDLHLGTGLIVALISFTLFGIEEIGIEIEHPFGHDANDLTLDQICAAIHRNIEDLMASSPSVRAHVTSRSMPQI